MEKFIEKIRLFFKYDPSAQARKFAFEELDFINKRIVEVQNKNERELNELFDKRSSLEYVAYGN